MSAAPVFVLGLMRSGTTLVQRVLNSHPGVTIWGEHGGAYRRIFTLPEVEPFRLDDHHRERIAHGYRRRKAVVGKLSDPAAFDAYVSPVEPEGYEDSLDDIIRRHLEGLFTTGLAPGTVWGFKETRYAGNVFPGLARLFPDARFVFVTRSAAPWVSSVVRAPFRQDLGPDDLADEAVTAAAIDRLLDLWKRRTAAQARFVRADPASRLLISHERFGDLPSASDLFGRLGLSDPPRRSLSAVIDARAGSSDAAPEWTGDTRDRLESAIARALDAREDLGALEDTVRELHRP